MPATYGKWRLCSPKSHTIEPVNIGQDWNVCDLSGNPCARFDRHLIKRAPELFAALADLYNECRTSAGVPRSSPAWTLAASLIEEIRHDMALEQGGMFANPGPVTITQKQVESQIPLGINHFMDGGRLDGSKS